jgi:hypothetical protein
VQVPIRENIASTAEVARTERVCDEGLMAMHPLDAIAPQFGDWAMSFLRIRRFERSDV